MKTLLFVELPIGVDDLALQETARRERLFSAIFSRGPRFTSNNYGTITFMEEGAFSWSGFDLLVPQHIPESILAQSGGGTGAVSMDLFLDSALEDRYSGAFTLRFANAGRETALRCMYFLDNQGFRLEIVPEANIDGVVVIRRAASPMILYFFRDEELW